MGWWYRLASIKLTLVGMVLLCIGAILSYGSNFDFSVWVLVLPLGWLSVNLLAAIATNRKINRQPGLLIFHLGLLGIAVLAAIGRLTHLDGQVEIITGQSFEPGLLQEVKKGPWHRWGLAGGEFIQGQYIVNYEPGLQRGATYSHVYVRQPDGTRQHRVVGDDKPLLLGGYRFYTTFNKGFAPILTWIPDAGQPVTGSVNMPSYPLYEYKQKNAWSPPGTNEQIEFWLTLKTPYTESDSWSLQQETSSGILVVTAGDQRVELNVGDEVRLTNGRLRYEELRMWMGYTIFHDPTLRWLFLVSVLAVLGLGWHLWQKTAQALPLQSEDKDGEAR